MAIETPTVLDLFAGAGGASIGLHRAGLEHVGACEIEHDQCATMEAGTGAGMFGRRSMGWSGDPLRVYRCPVQDLDPPAADWWWGSPPCQAFSAAGRRLGPGDPRNGWPWLFDALDRSAALGRAPAWLLAENVPGMLSHRSSGCDATCPGCYWLCVLEEATQRFARVSTWVLDAADYGVPQHRRRLILVAGPAPVEAPAPTHSAASLAWARDDGDGEYTDRYVRWVEEGEHPGPGPDGLLPHVPMRVALGLGFGAHVFGGGHNPSCPGDARRLSDLSDRPSTTIAAQSGGGAGNAGPFVETGHRTTSPAPTMRASQGTVAALVEGEAEGALEAEHPPWWHRASPPDEPSRTVGSKGNAAILLDRPAPTVTTTEVKGARPYRDGAHGGPDRASDALSWGGAGRRRLTVRECALLQGFPSDWPFHGNAGSQYQQVGNAVPPELARVVASAVLGIVAAPGGADRARASVDGSPSSGPFASGEGLR